MICQKHTDDEKNKKNYVKKGGFRFLFGAGVMYCNICFDKFCLILACVLFFFWCKDFVCR